MAFLALSGIPLMCLKSWRYQPTLMGTKARAFSGFPYSSVRKTLMTYSAETAPLKLADAALLRALINGDGDSWSFDTSTVSSRGLIATMTGTVAVEAGGARFGTGQLKMQPGAAVSWATGLGAEWTVAYWAKLTTASAWTHYIHRPGRFIARSGVLNAATPNSGFIVASDGTYAAFTGGAVKLQAPSGFPNNPSNVPLLVDDLVALPYVIPDVWVAPWYASTAAFGPLPHHRATGDGLHKPARVLGTAKDGDALELWDGGVRVVAESFAFELMEAP
ncbi:hypothetical protein JY651_28785 [Pyxidicoccus parkwayensis]|uniref:DUF2793 domain-containing protein n=1 Tax=Pyxidicoccus parkwayensis TaxID=2813578 RepID=A0ABX7NLU0_9BACT|nr:hypothetical protein [Pyxidicoccus parkwaysis]QSQ19329.1 hypothetical protein JY651_28785 [Pyxidicoccus parkwaysis]